MEIITQGTRRILVAKEGYVLQSVTDGSIVGRRLFLGKKDSEIHYHEIPEAASNEGNTEE